MKVKLKALRDFVNSEVGAHNTGEIFDARPCSAEFLVERGYCEYYEDTAEAVNNLED